MASDVAVDMLVPGTTEKSGISTIIMDKDSTTIAEIKKSVPHEVTKESDTNHAKKTVGKASHPFTQSYFLLSKIFFIRNQGAQE